MEKIQNNDLYLVYVKCVNTRLHEYSLYFSETPDVVWGVDWDVKIPNSLNDLTPDKTTYSKVINFCSPFTLTTIEEISCYSMEYAVNKIIALSWIDISLLEEYPECGRCVLHFGDTYEKVKKILLKMLVEI